MEPTRAELESLDRDSLIGKAEAAGVSRARVLTRPELVDEILLRQGRDAEATRRARGLLGRARDLLARLVERGLHLPDAADRVRGTTPPPPLRRNGAAVPTVTLAEIYATQGHKDKALETLRQVLEREPEHLAAKNLVAKLSSPSYAAPAPKLPPEAEGAEERPVDGGEASMGSGGFTAPVTSSTGAPEGAMGMIDAQPFPPKYDVDECVAIAVDPSTLFVYWELRDDTLAALQKREPTGTLALRVLAIVPTWDGPRTITRDIEVGAQLGDWFVRELPEDAIVRAAIGWLSEGGSFLSAAHSFPAQPAPRDRAPVLAERLARWTPHGTFPVAPDDVQAAAVARALARSEARRVAEERIRRGETGAWVPGERAPLGSSERFGLGSSERFGLGSSERLGASEGLVRP